MLTLNVYETIFMIVMIGVITLMATSIIKTMFLIMRNVLTVIGGIAVIIAIATVVINYM